MIKAIDANMYLYLFVENIAPIQEIDTANCIHFKRKHSKKCTFYTLRFGCSFAAVNTIKPQLL